tara:strand:- start:109 stop:711 length:603 start_codon:yes stop_codon:yes gene_type:complete
MRIFALLILFTLLSPNTEKVLGDWYAPNGIIHLTVRPNGIYEMISINADSVQKGIWEWTEDNFILDQDTFQLRDDTLWFKNYFFFTKDFKGGYQEKLTREAVIGTYWRKWRYDETLFMDTVTYNTNGTYMRSSDTTTGNWRIEQFQGFNYLYVEDIFRQPQPLLIMEWKTDSLVLQYYDNGESGYHQTKWKKIKTKHNNK